MEVAPRALPRSSTADHVAASLRESILRGELPPGSPIDETRFADAFGTSRNTMREAIRALARAGLVVPARRRPATVTQLTAQDVADIFSVRALIELDAVRRAIRDPESDMSALERPLGDLVAFSATKGDWHRIVDADAALHAAIVASSRSPRLVRAYESIGAEIRLGLSLTDRWDTDPADQVAKHRRLVALLEVRDEHASVEFLDGHIRDSRERALSVLTR